MKPGGVLRLHVPEGHVNEAAWDAARDQVEGGHRQLLLRVARQLREEIRDEERPRLQRLLAAAAEHRTPVVLDTTEELEDVYIPDLTAGWSSYMVIEPYVTYTDAQSVIDCKGPGE